MMNDGPTSYYKGFHKYNLYVRSRKAAGVKGRPVDSEVWSIDLLKSICKDVALEAPGAEVWSIELLKRSTWNESTSVAVSCSLIVLPRTEQI